MTVTSSYKACYHPVHLRVQKYRWFISFSLLLMFRTHHSYWYPQSRKHVCTVNSLTYITGTVCLFHFWHCSILTLFYFLYITHNDPPQAVGLLWTSDQLVTETSTWQHTTLTHKHPCPGGIRSHNLSRRAAADVRLRPRGHWDRHKREVKVAS
jgi:hypothetical protein